MAGENAGEEALDFSDVVGQEAAKRMLLVGAAGLHGVLMRGPAGCGKTMLSRRLPTILPRLTEEEQLEVAQIYSVAGLAEGSGVLRGGRPFRAPHHTVTGPALIGGGVRPVPGEVSLAHCGVLFLDELPEFRREVLELLRQPLEEKRVRICRSGGVVTFPADFMLVGAMNPCPCGQLGDPQGECTCTQTQLRRYRSRLSQPFLDRIDLLAELAPVSRDQLPWREQPGKVAGSREMREGVERAWTRQQERFAQAGLTGIHFNSQMDSHQILRFCPMKAEAEELLQQAFSRLSLSARGLLRVLRVARTVADLAGEEQLSAAHVAEAVRYRCPEGGAWNR